MALTDEEQRLFSGIITDLVDATTKMGTMLLIPAGLRPDEEWGKLRKARLPSPGSENGRLVVDGLMKKMERSHDPNMWGILLSILGWAPTVVEAIKVDRHSKNVLLINGVDLRGVLAGHMDFAEMVRRKQHYARWKSLPYVPLGELFDT